MTARTPLQGQEKGPGEREREEMERGKEMKRIGVEVGRKMRMGSPAYFFGLKVALPYKNFVRL